ncbi:RNA polymerase subunit sigma [Terribacillus sp. 179-K 1B1 HS]|uniref:RNA polymerase subunit sigma n=1 Tax=Terribacillus sp. 179-K 1B1 HS TaxID=3142388 RepID=UPI0039A25E5C
MGAVKRDMHAAERQHAERYALDNADGVRLLLADYHALVQRQYAGDYDAVIILADLQCAIDMAALTWRQKSALHYVFIEQWTQEMAAGALGIDRTTVAHYVSVALIKIADVYEKWSWQGEGYCVYITNEKGLTYDEI